MREYLRWRRSAGVRDDYEKKRLFEFQAITSIGSIVLGIAALWFASTQYRAESAHQAEDDRAAADKAEREEIVRAATMLRSVDPTQQASGYR